MLRLKGESFKALNDLTTLRLSNVPLWVPSFFIHTAAIAGAHDENFSRAGNLQKPKSVFLSDFQKYQVIGSSAGVRKT